MYLNTKNVTYFDSFGVEHIPKETRKFIENNTLGYFCIGFIDFILKGKSLLQYTNLFSSNEYKIE